MSDFFGGMNIFDGVDLKGSMSSVAKSTTETMANLKDQTLKPISAVSGGIKDGAALVSQKQTEVLDKITSFKSTMMSTIDSTIGALSGGILNIDSIQQVITYDNGFKINKDILARKVSDNIGIDIANIPNLPAQFADNMLAEFNRATDYKLNSYIDKSGIRMKMGNWRGLGGDSLLSYLRRTTDDLDGAIDLASKNALLITLLYQAAGLGMVASYKTLYNQFTYPETDGQDALVGIIDTVLIAGDLDSIAEIFSLMNYRGLRAVQAQYPTFVEELLTNYHLADDQSFENYAALRDQFLYIFTTLKGENWYQIYTSFGWLPNIAISSNMSDDAFNILSEVEHLIPILAAKDVFSDGTAVTTFKTHFPTVPIIA